jgi:hypothetical protein
MPKRIQSSSTAELQRTQWSTGINSSSFGPRNVVSRVISYYMSAELMLETYGQTPITISYDLRARREPLWAPGKQIQTFFRTIIVSQS